MTQDAIVYKCLNDQLAEVVVTRATACGSNCANDTAYEISCCDWSSALPI